jgi:hypothetical protein
MCYSCTGDNYMAYKYNKVNKLVTNRLFYVEKYTVPLCLLRSRFGEFPLVTIT